MTTHSLRRWGAVLIAGGVVTFVAYLFFPGTAADPLIQTCAAGVLVGLLLLLPGLFAFQRAQSERAAVNGWIGAGLLAAGIVVIEFPHCILALVDRDRLLDLDSFHASFLGQAEFYAIIPSRWDSWCSRSRSCGHGSIRGGRPGSSSLTRPSRSPPPPCPISRTGCASRRPTTCSSASWGPR